MADQPSDKPAPAGATSGGLKTPPLKRSRALTKTSVHDVVHKSNVITRRLVSSSNRSLREAISAGYGRTISELTENVGTIVNTAVAHAELNITKAVGEKVDGLGTKLDAAVKKIEAVEQRAQFQPPASHLAKEPEEDRRRYHRPWYRSHRSLLTILIVGMLAVVLYQQWDMRKDVSETMRRQWSQQTAIATLQESADSTNALVGKLDKKVDATDTSIGELKEDLRKGFEAAEASRRDYSEKAAFDKDDTAEFATLRANAAKDKKSPQPDLVKEFKDSLEDLKGRFDKALENQPPQTSSVPPPPASEQKKEEPESDSSEAKVFGLSNDKSIHLSLLLASKDASSGAWFCRNPRRLHEFEPLAGYQKDPWLIAGRASAWVCPNEVYAGKVVLSSIAGVYMTIDRGILHFADQSVPISHYIDKDGFLRIPEDANRVRFYLARPINQNQQLGFWRFN